MKIMSTDSPLNCLRLCTSEERLNCTWFTYNPQVNDDNCELYQTCGNVSADTECGTKCISGEADCPKVECNLDGMCQVSMKGTKNK